MISWKPITKAENEGAVQLEPSHKGHHILMRNHSDTNQSPKYACLLALLSFRAVGGFRDHQVQPPHLSDEKTMGWKNEFILNFMEPLG